MLLIAFGCSSQVYGNEFLKSPNELIERVSEDDIRISFLDEVEASLGQGSASKRLSEMETSLRPIFTALPKNGLGNLGHSGVSYALHRLFVLRHGWVIKGLAQTGNAANVSSPSGVLKDQVPSFIENMFEKRLAGKGFGLHELALLAATIEHLIHNEAITRLGSVFNVLSLPVTSPISSQEASEVLDTYMMAYIMGETLKGWTAGEVREINKQMPELFLAWHDTQEFVSSVRKNVTEGEGVLSFADIAKVAEVVGESYGSFQNRECQDLKNTLVKVEYRGTGRVQLADFYKPSLSGSWTFQESLGYLRRTGALDESDPDQPSVMIPNYITSQANCLGDSGFYSVCCKNECEGLLGYLEEKIGATEAKPSVINDLVSSLASSTVPAPHFGKTASLRKHLEDIAANHDGMVPLHSRLFAQYMHHMFPRECPFPHMSGTTESLSGRDFIDEGGSLPVESQEDIEQHVAKANKKRKPAAGKEEMASKVELAVAEVMPWSQEDELLVVRSLSAEELLRPHASTSAAMRSVLLLAIAISLSVALVQTMKTPLNEVFPRSQKHMS